MNTAQAIVHALLYIWEDLPPLLQLSWPKAQERIEDFLSSLAHKSSQDVKVELVLQFMNDIECTYPTLMTLLRKTVKLNPLFRTRTDQGTESGKLIWADLTAYINHQLSDSPVRRTLAIEAPDTFSLNMDALIRLSLVEEPLPEAICKLDLFMDRQLEVRLIVDPSAFEVIGPCEGMLGLKPKNLTLAFQVRPVKIGQFQVILHVLRSGSTLEYIPIPLKVDPASLAKATIRPFNTSINIQAPRHPPDIELLVHAWPEQQGSRLAYQFHSLYDLTDNQLIEGPLIHVIELSQEYISSIELIHADAGKGSLSLAQRENELQTKGLNLYRVLHADRLLQVLTDAQQLISREEPQTGRRLTLQIVTDLHLIPWEIMRPFDSRRHSAQKIETDYLCQMFDVTRRFLSHSQMHLSRLKFSRYAFIEGANLTASRSEEKAKIDKILGSQFMDCTAVNGALDFLDLQAVFKQGGIELFYFCGTGIGAGQGSHSFSFLLPDGVSLRPDDLTGGDLSVRDTLARDRPFFFLNACSLAQCRNQQSNTLGWPDFAADCGAAGLIAPLWKVNDSCAEAFAVRFFECLSEGFNLAEAVRFARTAALNRGQITNDPSWAAYCVFANPRAKALFPLVLPQKLASP